MQIEQLHDRHPLWPRCLDHLARLEMARWILDDGAMLKPALYMLCAVTENRVAGHISLKMQVITIPMESEHPDAVPLTAPDGRLLRELFVQTFGMDSDYRRQGYGRALQLAALDLGKTFGCYQMRSWSSLDKTANFALKTSLGFAAHPATQRTPGGDTVAGVYFVKTIA